MSWGEICGFCRAHNSKFARVCTSCGHSILCDPLAVEIARLEARIADLERVFSGLYDAEVLDFSEAMSNGCMARIREVVAGRGKVA